jgi:hypothetical protein
VPNMLREKARFTLSKAQYLHPAGKLLVVLPAIGLISMAPSVTSLWCLEFDMPGYERVFGFRLGQLAAPCTEGGTYKTGGFVSVEPGGILGRADVRAGDVPHAYHGMPESCDDLDAAGREGRAPGVERQRPPCC